MPTLALIGAAHIHTPNFIDRLNKRPEFRVKFVWDHDGSRAAKAAEKLGSQTTSDLNAIWRDAEIDAVIICTETDRHERVVLGATAAGKHLFVEKPLGYASADAYRMAKAIEDAGLLFQTGYFMRGLPVHQFLKQQVEAGHFGKITRVRHSNCHSGSLGGWFDGEWRWMADPQVAGVGAFGDLGTHSLDILLWLLGEVEKVTAATRIVTGRYKGCDETGEGLLSFANGVIGTLAAGWVDVADPVTAIVSGAEGHAYVAGGKLYFKSKHVEGADGKEPWDELPEMQPHAFELFLDALTGKEVSLVSPSEAAYRSAVMEALYAGAASEAWVTPKSGLG